MRANYGIPDLACMGAQRRPYARQPIPVADREATGTFYLHDPSVGLIWVVNGGAHFRNVLNTMLPLDLERTQPRAMPGRTGEIWIPPAKGCCASPG
jgi:hypothetical protein